MSLAELFVDFISKAISLWLGLAGAVFFTVWSVEGLVRLFSRK